MAQAAEKNNISIFKIIGAVLLIIGTSIGGGILALPLALAQGGFLYAACFLVGCWMVMTAGAFCTLEVTLCMPEGANMITMARNTLGGFGALISWFFYLLLLYSLLCAYMSASSDVVQALLHVIHISVPLKICVVITTILIALVIYCGVSSVDVVNRFIMTTKLLAFFAIILAIMPNIHFSHLQGGHILPLFGVVTVMITSYGYAIIVPSIRTYFHSDVKLLRRVILIGSAIPLVCYLLWIFAIFGVIHKHGSHGLIAIANSGHASSGLMNALGLLDIADWFGSATKVFTTLCVFTSFLGVSLCLFDFYADGLQLTKRGRSGLMVLFLTYVPPMLIVLFSPGVFLYGLSFAGIACAFILILLPALMSWFARYHCPSIHMAYQVRGGKIFLLTVMALGLGVILLGLWHDVIAQFI